MSLTLTKGMQIYRKYFGSMYTCSGKFYNINFGPGPDDIFSENDDIDIDIAGSDC